MVDKFFLLVKWCDCIRPIDNMSLKLASNEHVKAIGKIIPFVQLGDLHLCAHFGVMNNLAVPPLIGTSFINSFVKGKFHMEQRIISI